MYKPKGSFSAAMFDSIRRAETMQALVLENIHGKYETDKDATDIFTMTWQDFVAELENAYDTDGMEELNARFAQMLAPFVQMALQPPQQEGNQ